MPYIIDPIDKIARQKQRDVLYINFHNINKDILEHSFDWENSKDRQQVIHWLNVQSISYYPCFQVWNDGLIICPYMGQLYLDVPYDNNNRLYKQLEAFFKNHENSMKFPDVTFCYLPLEIAMQNAHHDNPNYGND